MAALPLNTARKNLERLRTEAAKVLTQARTISARGTSGSEITASEEAEFHTLVKRAKTYESEIALARLDVTAAADQADMADAFSASERHFGEGNMSINNVARYGVPLPEGKRLSDLPDADPTKTLDDFGEYTRALLMGETRAQSEGGATEGSTLVPVSYATPVLDIAVNAMQVKQAGAAVVAMDSKTTQVGRLTSDPIPSWRAEAAAITESAGVFSAVTLTAKSLAVYVKVSLELLEDARPEFGQVLGTSLARAFALEADRVALYGSGAANQPLGVKGTAGVSITNFSGVNGGQITAVNGNYNALISAVGRLKGRNYVPSGLLFSPRVESTLALLADTTGQPLAEPDYLKEIPHYVSGQVPNNLTVGTSSDCSDFIAGDFSKLILGVRTDFRILPMSETFLVSGGQIGFVGWLRMDVQVARTDAFEILAGIRA